MINKRKWRKHTKHLRKEMDRYFKTHPQAIFVFAFTKESLEYKGGVYSTISHRTKEDIENGCEDMEALLIELAPPLKENKDI